MKNNKMMKASVASAMLLGLVAPTVLATTNVATAAEEAQSKQVRNVNESINATQGDDSITIKAANGISLDKETFNAYRLMDAHYINDKEEGYKIIPAWQDFFDKEVTSKKGEHCTDEEAHKYLEAMKSNPDQLKTFQEHVFDYATDSKNKIQPLGTPNAQKDTYKITNLPDGYYSVIQVAKDDTTALSYNMLVTVDKHNQNAEIKLKADVPSLLKTINGEVTGNQDKKAVDFAIGDDVPFHLVTKVPDMSGFKKDSNSQHGGRYVFEVCDTMSKGLTLDPQSIDIKIGNQKYTNYTLVDAGTDKAGDHKYRIVFGRTNAPSHSDNIKDNDILSDDDGVLNDDMFQKAGTPIVINYKAKLNENAKVGKEGNANTANVLFSSNPYVENKVNHTWDSTTHAFTFALDLTKVNDDKKTLAGAEFKLTTNDGKEIKVKELSTGQYVVSNEEGATSTVVSPDNGQISIKGLDAGSYKLVETKAPAGYNLLDKALDFTITPEYSKVNTETLENIEGKLNDLKVTGDGFSVKEDKGTVSTTVVNKAGGLLPKTGGRGIFMLAAIGLALMALATYVLFGRKKATK